MTKTEGLSIAVIGSGVAGIVSAYLLQRRHTIRLYEKNDYIGGHTHTIVVNKGPDKGTPVDTGFIVFNKKTYPNFIRFLSQLDVSKRPASMSFSYYDQSSGLQYASRDLNTFFAQRKNIFSLSFWHMFLDIVIFNRITPSLFDKGILKGLTMGEYLRAYRFSRPFIRQYLLPVSAAVWSSPDSGMLDFPMETFARFFYNHGLFSLLKHPQWYTVSGGSHEYVKAFLQGFKGRIYKACPVKSISRTDRGAVIRTGDGAEEHVDKVVIATHADEALALLADPSEEEASHLSKWSYSNNRTILHTDTSFLPPDKDVWSSWNYVRRPDVESGSPVNLTYYMNRLQGLSRSTYQYCVTLNTERTIPKKNIIRKMIYTHPLYTSDAFASQTALRGLNGKRNTYFCGSYLGYGFHEDAVKSAIDVAAHFGIDL